MNARHAGLMGLLHRKTQFRLQLVWHLRQTLFFDANAHERNQIANLSDRKMGNVDCSYSRLLSLPLTQTNREIRIGVKRMRKKEPSKISEDGWWTKDNHMHEEKKRRKKGEKGRIRFLGEKSREICWGKIDCCAAGVQYGWLWLLSVQSSIFRSYFFQGLLQRIRHFLQGMM